MSLGCKIDGRIEKEDIFKITEHVEKSSKTHEKLRIYVEVEKIGLIKPEALFADIQMALKHFKKFEKKVVVTDKEWMMKLTPVFDKLFPNIDLKCFDYSKKDEALEWVKVVINKQAQSPFPLHKSQVQIHQDQENDKQLSSLYHLPFLQ